MRKCLNITYSDEVHLVFILNRNVVESGASTKTVLQFKNVFGLCTKLW